MYQTYTEPQKRNAKTAEKLRLVGQYPRAEKIELCSRWWESDMYGSIKTVHTTKVNRCHDRLCAWCAPIRAEREARALAQTLRNTLSPDAAYHMVLTIPSYPLGGLKEMVKELLHGYDALARQMLGQRRSSIGIHAAGTWRSLEFTYDPVAGWHAHLHCLLHCFPFDEGPRGWDDHTPIERDVGRRLAGMCGEFERMYEVRIDRIEDISTGVREVAKYGLKLSDIDDWPPAALIEWCVVTKGLRLYDGRGTLRGVEDAPPEVDKETRTAIAALARVLGKERPWNETLSPVDMDTVYHDWRKIAMSNEQLFGVIAGMVAEDDHINERLHLIGLALHQSAETVKAAQRPEGQP